LSQPAQAKTHTDGAPLFDLAAILAPLDAGFFLASEYGKTFRHVPGETGKFSALLPWPVLNSILEQHRLEPPRLRLTREGQSVSPEKYLTRQANRRASREAIPRLNAANLTRELREGATLVLDSVDELHPPVRQLAESLERVFRVRVQVNAYAGWRTSHGFDLHWDDHDVFILQVAGRKQWKVYGMTRPYPLARDIEPAVDPPSEVLWEGLLQSGDLLYIPRGWWHVATPLDEPTLHLTVGVNNPTGVDLLTWFVDRLRAIEDVRRDIPHLIGAGAQFSFADCLRDILINQWHPGVVDEFLTDMDTKSRPRPNFSLPWTATGEMLPSESWRVRWNSARQASIASTGADGEFAVAANGRRWTFAEASRPLLELLLSRRECDLSDLERAAAGTLPSDVIRTFIKELAANGLLVIL
jgi:hypothetical protein